MSHDFLWSEKYRPQRVQDCILPPSLKLKFQEIVDDNSVPNMLFSGTAGLGKTTVAKAICNELGLDCILINASEEGNIDTLRNKIKKFASTVSLSGNGKVVILDEADYLNPQSTQPALRGFMEEFHDNCRFILTCNHKNRIIEPLHSRCSVYEFNVSNKEMAIYCVQFLKRMEFILSEESVEYDRGKLAELIGKYAPDWRRTINECQRNVTNGKLNIQAKLSASADVYNDLFDALKNKDFRAMRKWVVDNMDLDGPAIIRGIYDQLYDRIEDRSIPQLVIILDEYAYKHAFVSDSELNIVACMTEIMANIDIK